MWKQLNIQLIHFIAPAVYIKWIDNKVSGENKCSTTVTEVPNNTATNFLFNSVKRKIEIKWRLWKWFQFRMVKLWFYKNHVK